MKTNFFNVATGSYLRLRARSAVKPSEVAGGWSCMLRLFLETMLDSSDARYMKSGAPVDIGAAR